MMRRDDRGQVTAFITVMTTALIFVIGLVYDGGNVLAARREAANEAEQAARAGAQSLSEDAIRAGSHTLDPGDADAAARAYMANHPGHRITNVDVAGPCITVTVAIDQPAFILAFFSRTVTGTATARNARGVLDADPGGLCP